MDRHHEYIDALNERIAALELQVQKLDRLVYKLFKRLPYRAGSDDSRATSDQE